MEDIYEALKNIMKPHVLSLDIKHDEPGHFYVDTLHVMKNKKPLWFGGVRIKKNYVSYYLMPVYRNPELLSGMSSELKKRMQGKSCFNFKSIDKTLFSELALLTKSGLEDYRKEGFLN
jgi:hypothetical protein